MKRRLLILPLILCLFNASAFNFHFSLVFKDKENTNISNQEDLINNVAKTKTSEPEANVSNEQLEQNPSLVKGLKNHMADTLRIKADSLFNHGNNAMAIEYYFQELKILEEMGPEKEILYTLNQIGLIYGTQGKHSNALIFYNRCRKKIEESGNNQQLASVLNNIGNIYKEQGDHSNALGYFTKSKTLYKKIKDLHGLALALNNIGGIYYDESKYNMALENHQLSLKIRKEINDPDGIATSLISIGLIKRLQGDFESAFDCFIKGLRLRKELDDNHGIAACLIDIGENYRWNREYKKAIPYFEDAMTLSIKIGAAIPLRDVSKLLYKSYKALGDHQQALKMHELFMTLRDSIKDEEITKTIIRHEFEIKEQQRIFNDKEAKRKAKELQIALEENKARTDNIQYTAIFILVILTLLLIFALSKRGNISIKIVESIIFFNFLLIFEFILLFINPIVAKHIYNAPVLLLGINSIIALLITPLHNFMEVTIKARVLKIRKHSQKAKRML